jgi:hypothetical protein
MEWLSSPIEDSPPGDLQLQLNEMVIHQQDIRRAISRPRSIPRSSIVEVLGYSTSLVGSFSINLARWRLRGLQLIATDGQWSYGAGAKVTGPGESLVMAVNGRPEALSDLSGSGATTLTRRTMKSARKFTAS